MRPDDADLDEYILEMMRGQLADLTKAEQESQAAKRVVLQGILNHRRAMTQKEIGE